MDEQLKAKIEKEFANTPMADGLGIRGPQQPGTTIREMGGADGGNGAYDVGTNTAPGVPPSGSDPQQSTSTVLAYVVFSGTARKVSFVANQVG